MYIQIRILLLSIFPYIDNHTWSHIAYANFDLLFSCTTWSNLGVLQLLNSCNLFYICILFPNLFNNFYFILLISSHKISISLFLFFYFTNYYFNLTIYFLINIFYIVNLSHFLQFFKEFEILILPYFSESGRYLWRMFIMLRCFGGYDIFNNYFFIFYIDFVNRSLYGYLLLFGLFKIWGLGLWLWLY